MINLIQDINIILYKCLLEWNLTAANKRDQEFPWNNFNNTRSTLYILQYNKLYVQNHYIFIALFLGFDVLSKILSKFMLGAISALTLTYVPFHCISKLLDNFYCKRF